MLRVRVIPVLFLMDGQIVRSEGFNDFKVIGNPYSELERYSQWRADELVYVDISRGEGHGTHRGDHKVKVDGDLLSILRVISRHAFMPLTFGGHVDALDQASEIISNGADKVLVNTAAYRDPSLVTAISERHGIQATVVGIDILRESGELHVLVDQGRERTGLDLVNYARRIEALGAGEILLNSIDRDGSGNGYDLEAIEMVAGAVSIPVIACGGCGVIEHMAHAVSKGASAVAAGNIFHFTENAYPRAKQTLRRKGVAVR